MNEKALYHKCLQQQKKEMKIHNFGYFNLLRIEDIKK